MMKYMRLIVLGLIGVWAARGRIERWQGLPIFPRNSLAMHPERQLPGDSLAMHPDQLLPEHASEARPEQGNQSTGGDTGVGTTIPDYVPDEPRATRHQPNNTPAAQQITSAQWVEELPEDEGRE